MDPIRLLNTLLDAISDVSGPFAYATIVGILLICGLGVPIPEDITLLASGLLASDGSISLAGALIACFAGVLMGDAVLFFMGRRYGKRVFNLPGLRRLFTPDRIVSAEKQIRKNGPLICFIARFLPGLRSPVFAMSGALGVRPMTFFMLDGIAALISVPIWVYMGYWFGNNLEEALKRAKHIQSYLFMAIAVVIVAYFLFRFWKGKRKEKLQLLSSPDATAPREELSANEANVTNLKASSGSARRRS